jgi:sterol desaturase/sphingolipid hydroxylase (fatty acid hydroxylase superfamily)
MKDWTWQKWLGKIMPILTALLAVGVWEFAELPAPAWAGTAAGLLTVIVQGIIALFPPKAA